ncbi:hypothetical protein H9P43_003707 [Blastocladiella emersonii ATCC 22665]|nr:hypothetical protein H9P43_003707 [Blastocladiella emersonii ATCC 22665]
MAITTFSASMVVGVRVFPVTAPLALPRESSNQNDVARHFDPLSCMTPPELAAHFGVFLLRHLVPRPVVDRTVPKLETWVFAAATTDEARAAVKKLRCWLNADSPRCFLVVVNPFSGRKRGKRVAQGTLLPLLQLSHEDHTVLVRETIGPNHAATIAQEIDINTHDGALLVGGDGIVHEFVNGLLTRPDRDQIRHALPIAHVAAGSGNGLAASLNALNPARAVLAAIKGTTRPLDLMALYQDADPVSGEPETAPRHPTYCHLSFTWGYLGDVNIEAEPLRWMGPLRFELMAALRLVTSRSYGARIAFLPADAASASSEGESSTGADSSVTKHIHRPLAEIFAPTSEWTVLPSMRYFYLTAHNVPHQTYTFNAAPHAHPHDGTMDVCMLEAGANPVRLVPYLLDQTKGAHVGGPGVQAQKCRALVVVPLHPDDAELWNAYGPPSDGADPSLAADWRRRTTRVGNMVADGERIRYAPIRIETIPSMIRVFVPQDLDPGAFAAHAPPHHTLRPLGSTWARRGSHGKATPAVPEPGRDSAIGGDSEASVAEPLASG